jgi:hypothetical protein
MRREGTIMEHQGECTAIVTDWRTKYFQEVESHAFTSNMLDFSREVAEEACKIATEIGKYGLSDFIHSVAVKRINDKLKGEHK